MGGVATRVWDVPDKPPLPSDEDLNAVFELLDSDHNGWVELGQMLQLSSSERVRRDSTIDSPAAKQRNKKERAKNNWRVGALKASAKARGENPRALVRTRSGRSLVRTNSEKHTSIVHVAAALKRQRKKQSNAHLRELRKATRYKAATSQSTSKLVLLMNPDNWSVRAPV